MRNLKNFLSIAIIFVVMFAFATTAMADVVKPTLKTVNAVNITEKSVTLKGTILTNGGYNITDTGFYYGTTSTPTTKVSLGAIGSRKGSKEYKLSGLTSSTKYYFKFYVTNKNGTYEGSILNFTTLDSSATLANSIFNSSKITLAKAHASGKIDNAFAYNNIFDVKNGKLASRSKYENAPGGTTTLSPKLLKIMLSLSNKYSFSVSEIAGGSHSRRSHHYIGTAFDVNFINGVKVNNSNKFRNEFIREAKSLGAGYVKFENGNHIHIGLDG